MSTASVPVALSSPSHELEAQVAPKAATVLETARAIVVANDEQYAAASAFRFSVRRASREISTRSGEASSSGGRGRTARPSRSAA